MLRKYRINQPLVRSLVMQQSLLDEPSPKDIVQNPPTFVRPRVFPSVPEKPLVSLVEEPIEELVAANDPEPRGRQSKLTKLERGEFTATDKLVLGYFQLIFPLTITDTEMETHFHHRQSTLRTRRKELTDAGFIASTGEKRKINGTFHKIWVLTEKGRAISLS